jgi:hypothetical protein
VSATGCIPLHSHVRIHEQQASVPVRHTFPGLENKSKFWTRCKPIFGHFLKFTPRDRSVALKVAKTHVNKIPGQGCALLERHNALQLRNTRGIYRPCLIQIAGLDAFVSGPERLCPISIHSLVSAFPHCPHLLLQDQSSSVTEQN